MIDNCTTTESLNDEVLFFTPAVVFDGDLNDTVLDQVKFVRCPATFAEQGTLLVGESLHTVDQLLLGQQADIAEVRDLLHLHKEPRRQRVLVLEDLLLE